MGRGFLRIGVNFGRKAPEIDTKYFMSLPLSGGGVRGGGSILESENPLPMTNATRNISLLAVLALALAVSLHGLAADSFWGDEILTASFASQSPAQVIAWTAGDIHPPLYYLLAGGFTRLLAAEPGTLASDWLWRLPSVLATVLTVALAWPLTRHMAAGPHRHPAAISAGLLLSLSPVVVKYAQEARMHALFMLLAALSTALLFRALARPARLTRWLAYGLALTATIYTMYFGFLILAAHAGYLLAELIQRREWSLRSPRLAGFAAAVSVSLLLYLPWWPVLLAILRKRAAVGAIEGGVGSPLAFVPGVINTLGPVAGPVAWGFLALVVIGLIFLARRHWPRAVLAGLWLALPIGLPIFLGDPRALQFRYAFVLPLYLSVVSLAVWELAARLAAAARQVDSRARLGQFAVWALATVSLVGVLAVYAQQKPDWRDAAAYLTEKTAPGDIILIGPLWDEGRFIGYYYRGPAPLLTPAALLTNIEGRAAGLRQSGGRIWAVNRFAPAESPAFKNVIFPGVVVSEPLLAVYEAGPLTEATLNLAAQAVDAAYPWAQAAEAGGVLNPDPRTARAAALKALGDALLAAGRPAEAIGPYQTAVDIFPGWVNGYLALAEALEATGDLPGAARAYQQAVDYNLDWRGPAVDEAARLLAAEDWPAALAAYHQITGN